jgi:hypothetical protein
MRVIPEANKAVCDYCGTTVLIDDEIKRIEYTNAEEAGYNFEKGRLRAQAEQIQHPAMQHIQYEYVTPQKKKRHTFWWVMGWIFIFPIPATILILRNKKMHWILKTVLILLVWGIYLAIGFSGSANA